jgi:beta-glucanase (GH16 family)
VPTHPWSFRPFEKTLVASKRSEDGNPILAETRMKKQTQFYGCLLSAACYLLPAACSLLIAADAPKPDLYFRTTPDITPVERTTDQYPLSDQKNKANWLPYPPMTDEFNGAALDPAKWLPVNPGWKGRQPAPFLASNVTVSDGSLHLAMRSEEPSEDLKKLGYHTFTSAAVQSTARVLYGYFEIRYRPMNSAGSSSFWFYDITPDLWTEIDVFEIGAKAPGFQRKFNTNLHVFATPQERRHWSTQATWLAPADLAADWHTVGLDWNKDTLDWYFDGVLIRSAPNTHWHQPLTLNFDSETMPEWFGLPDPADLPSTYSIDYIRAWKRPEEMPKNPKKAEETQKNANK